MKLSKRRINQSRSPLRPCLLAVLGIGVLGLLQPNSAQAQTIQELAAEMRAMKSRITDLETKLAAAEAKVAAVEQTAASAEQSASTAVQVAASGGGAPSLSSEKGIVADGDVPLPVMPAQEGWWNKTTLGGYGEMHLNLGDKEQIDYHRFVLFLNHDFNDRVKLITELELEHSIAGDDQPGEVELEQAYLNFDLGNDYALRAGLFLLPVGIINRYHEPTTFFGTERPFVDSEILPTTWWEGGIGLNKKFDNGLALDLSGHSALDVPSEGDSAFRIRSGRKKVGEAPASAVATTFNAEHQGLYPGLGIGGSVQYQSDITQTTSAENNAAWLTEAHLTYQLGGFELRGVYGQWDIKGRTPASLGLDKQHGFYVEPSYTFATGFGDIGFFGRWSRLDAEKIDSHIYDVGMAYWPHENIVFKADYTKLADEEDDDFINFGVGFRF